VLVLFSIVSSLPTPEDRLANLHRRIDTEMKALADFAQKYRAEHGSYANKPTWKRFADRAHPRVFYPWGRPSRYEPSTSEVTIGTLGRDGLEGGSDEDADFFSHFSPSRPERPTL